jgi:hypothetical protein
MPTLVPVSVNFAGQTVTCNPDPVPVSRASNNGIQWTANQSGYTFTGVSIDGNAAPWGDFGTPSITTNAAGKSVMSVTDSVADLGDYTYSVLYTSPNGTPGSFDPTIRNEN